MSQTMRNTQPPAHVCQIIRKKLLSKHKEPFISLQTIKWAFAYEGSHETLGLYTSAVSTNSQVLLSALLLADLEHRYEPLLRSGLNDSTIFDADPLEQCCQDAGIPDSERDKLRESRAHFGVLLYQGRRPTISKGLVLPCLQRDKENNGSFGVIYKDEIASGHLRGFDEMHPPVSQLLSRVAAEKQIRPKDYHMGSPEEWNRLCREAITHEKRQHPNIVPLLASYFLDAEESERDLKTLHLIFPWADMDLAQWMNHTPIHNSTEDLSLRTDIYRQVYTLVSGLSYLHREIAEEITSHHDIKPSNILVFGREFKLADLGNTHLRPSNLGSETENDVLGTYEYQPPEYWTDSGDKSCSPHGRAFDAWAIGCVIIELALVIVYGWNLQKVAQFREARLDNSTKGRPQLHERRSKKDNSFHNNKDVVDEWVKQIKHDGSSRSTNLVLVAEALMAEDPKSRLYTWEAEMDLYPIYDVDADRPKRLEKNALCVQHSPRKIPNGTSTPLHRAAQRKDWDRVKDLLEHYWSLFVQDSTGMTPADILDQKARHMDKSCLQAYEKYSGRNGVSQPVIGRGKNPFGLLSHGDDQSFVLPFDTKIDWTAVDENGHNFLHCVLRCGSVDKLKCILRVIEKDQLRRRDPQTNRTPLQQAAVQGLIKQVELIISFLERKEYPGSVKTPYALDIEDQTSDGKTALFLAVENGHFATTEVLMVHEAQVFTKCKEGNTPIHAIASAERFVWSKKTLEKILCGDGAARCFEHKNKLGQTPIALSLTHHNFECFRLLKSKGASLNVVDDRGKNLLNGMARTPYQEQLDFNRLGNEERWILRDNQAEYWDHLTSHSYAVYKVVYDRCKPVHKSVRYRNFANHLENCGLDEKFVRRTWKRLLRTPNSDLENSTYPRPLVLATLYMLHLEHCAGIKIHEVSDERFNLLKRFDLWIKCHCSQQCKIEWNFANKSGMYRPPRESKTSCKAVQAKENFSIIPSEAKKTKLNNLFHRKNHGKILDDLYKAWKEHNQIANTLNHVPTKLPKTRQVKKGRIYSEP